MLSHSVLHFRYHISVVIRQSFFPSKTIQKDHSRSIGLFRKGKTRIIAKFHRTDLVICSHSRNRKTLSYSQINTVELNKKFIIFCILKQLKQELYTDYPNVLKYWDT